MPRPLPKLNEKQLKFIEMYAKGFSRTEIFQEAFGVDLNTAPKQEVQRIDTMMCRIRKRPEFMEIWRDEVLNVVIAASGKAIKKLTYQLDDEKQPWLVNKAANDIINLSRGLIFGDEDKTVTVKISGMPELGSPDTEEKDAKG